MCGKVLAVGITIIALSLAVIVSFWHSAGLDYIIFITRFFDVMLPVLGVGALLKFIFGPCNRSCNQKKKEDK